MKLFGGEFVPFEFLVEGGFADMQDISHLGNVTLIFFQLVRQDFLFELGHELLECRAVVFLDE